MSDARTLLIGVLGSLLASGLLYFVAAAGVAWSIAAGFGLLSIPLSYLALRRKNNNSLPLVGITQAKAGPNEQVEESLSTATTSIEFWGVSANRTARSPSAQQAMLRVAANGGSVRFLLMDPNGISLARRASDEGEQADSWAREIESTVTRLKSFGEHNGIALQVRYFDTYPVWRYICLDGNRIILNWFLPRKPGHHSPELLISSRTDGLLWPLRKAFDEAWNSGKDAIA